MLGACSDSADDDADDDTTSSSSGKTGKSSSSGGSSGKSSSSSGGKSSSSSGGTGSSSGESSSSSGSINEDLIEPDPGTPCPQVGQQFERPCGECGIEIAYCMQTEEGSVVSGYGACRGPSVCPSADAGADGGPEEDAGSSSGGGSSSSGGSSSGGTPVADAGSDAGPGPGNCTVITPLDYYWYNASLCGANGNQLCQTIYDTKFTPAIDGKANNWINVGYVPAMNVGTSVAFSYGDITNVMLYTVSYNPGDTAATARIFEAESGTFTLTAKNLNFGDVDATLTNVKLVESTWDEDGNPTRVPGGRCLTIPSARINVGF